MDPVGMAESHTPGPFSVDAVRLTCLPYRTLVVLMLFYDS